MKNVSKGLLPALMVSMILFNSCSKDAVIVSKDKSSAQAIEPIAMQSGGPIYSSTKHRLYVELDIELPTGGVFHAAGCTDAAGNCLKAVVIKGSKLSQELNGGPIAIENYFNGNEWTEHFAQEALDDDDFVSFMQSGNANAILSQVPGENGEKFYLIGENNGSAITVENAIYTIPIN